MDASETVALRREVDSLVKRVADLEELLFEFADPLRRYTARRVKAKQADLMVFAVTPSDEQTDRKALSDELVARFAAVTGREYVFDGARDGAALKRLLKLQPSLRPELMARWEECLRTKGYPGTHSLALFVDRRNSFGKKAAIPVVSVEGDPYGT